MRIAVSGTRYHPSLLQRAHLRQVMTLYRGMYKDRRIELGHGGCTGFDELSHYIGLGLHMLPVVLPAGNVNDRWKAQNLRDVYHLAPPEHTKVRNQRLVQGADIMITGPLHPENDARSSRSGTWQFARMARESRKPLLILHGDGTIGLSAGMVWPEAILAWRQRAMAGKGEECQLIHAP